MVLQAKSSLNPMSFISTKYESSVIIRRRGGGVVPIKMQETYIKNSRLIDSLLVYVMFENVSLIYAHLCRRTTAKS